MPEQAEVEIVIASRDNAVVNDIEGRLADLKPVRWQDARIVDPVTILAVVTGVAELIVALIALRKDLSNRPNAPRVEVKTADGRSIVLNDATPELLEATLSETRPS